MGKQQVKIQLIVKATQLISTIKWILVIKFKNQEFCFMLFIVFYNDFYVFEMVVAD